VAIKIKHIVGNGTLPSELLYANLPIAQHREGKPTTAVIHKKYTAGVFLKQENTKKEK